ncbi:MAG: type II secretion system protein [Armatimonadota bacterium]
MSSRSRGFTLIELLVVIAIIAILAAILFPVFASAKKTANASSCASNMKQLAMAQLMYAQDNGNCIARITQYPSPVTNDPFYKSSCPYWTWMTKIMPFIKNVGAFTCPGDKRKGLSGEWYNLPAKYSLGYAMWEWASDMGQDPRYGPAGAVRWKGSISQVRNASRIIMLTESYRGVPNGGPWWIGFAFAEAKKHGPKNNYAFYDGHVIALKMIETVNPSNNMWNHVGLWPAMIPMDFKNVFTSAQEMHDYAADYIKQCRSKIDVQE